MAAATIVKSIATEVAPSPFASFRTGEEVLDPSLCIHDVALAAYDIKDTRLVVDVEGGAPRRRRLFWSICHRCRLAREVLGGHRLCRCPF